MLQLAFLPCYGTEVDLHGSKVRLCWNFSSGKLQLPLAVRPPRVARLPGYMSGKLMLIHSEGCKFLSFLADDSRQECRQTLRKHKAQSLETPCKAGPWEELRNKARLGVRRTGCRLCVQGAEVGTGAIATQNTKTWQRQAKTYLQTLSQIILSCGCCSSFNDINFPPLKAGPS